MLELDETLFVEHKSDLGGDSFGLAKAAAAFANTLGGWLLIGVRDAAPYGSEEPWASDDGPNLVDVVRDLLRGVLDPLPAFEARRFDLDAGPVGVIRVYESSDTPHVNLHSGAVYVREPAGDSDVAKLRKRGSGARAERLYESVGIRSQAHLVALASRGHEASARVERLLDPVEALPLISNGLGLRFEALEDGVTPVAPGAAGIFVRLAPYTLAPRFRGWSTTADAAAALLAVAETVVQRQGFSPDWVRPDPAGAWITIGPGGVVQRHTDGAGCALNSEVRLVIDGAGVVGAALLLESPETGRRTWISADDIAVRLIRPAIDAVAALLRTGEFLGRARCQVDLVDLGDALMVEQTQGTSPRFVPRSADLVIPADESAVRAVAILGAYAFARGSGARLYDPPVGLH